MKKFLVDLIKFNNRVSQQGIDQQPTEPMPAHTVQPAENLDSLILPARGILDREALRLYRAMDLAG